MSGYVIRRQRVDPAALAPPPAPVDMPATPVAVVGPAGFDPRALHREIVGEFARYSGGRTW